jgi:hypothetical protein
MNQWWMNTNTHQLCTEEQRRALCRSMTAAQEKEWLDDWTRQAMLLEFTDLKEMGCGEDICTSFKAVDARSSNLDFEHITEPLLFVTCITGGVHSGIRTFWSTYEQATLGHMYWVLKHAAMNTQDCIMQIREEDGIGYQLTDRHEHASIALRDVTLKKLDCRSAVESMISHIGATSMADLIRANDYIPRSKRLPLVLPIAGYPSDIERFMQL